MPVANLAVRLRRAAAWSGAALAVVLLVASCAQRAPAPRVDLPDSQAQPAPAPAPDPWALADIDPDQADKVVVLKGERELYLMHDGRPFKRYEISLGWAPVGHKFMEGDGRTPEGLYTLDYKNEDSEFYRSIHISYPNAQDRRRARAAGVDPGHSIVVHGLGPEMAFLGKTHRAADWTNGCIALTNQEMDEIWSYIDPPVPIDIRP
jgi:murein L,D-transpeptidase YafK